MTQRGFRAPLHYMGEPIGVAARRYLGYVFDALVRFGMDKDEASNVIANHLTTIMVAGEHDENPDRLADRVWKSEREHRRQFEATLRSERLTHTRHSKRYGDSLRRNRDGSEMTFPQFLDDAHREMVRQGYAPEDVSKHLSEHEARLKELFTHGHGAPEDAPFNIPLIRASKGRRRPRSGNAAPGPADVLSVFYAPDGIWSLDEDEEDVRYPAGWYWLHPDYNTGTGPFRSSREAEADGRAALLGTAWAKSGRNIVVMPPAKYSDAVRRRMSAYP